MQSGRSRSARVLRYSRANVLSHPALTRMPYVHYVTVLHNVILAFQAQGSASAGIGFGTGFEQLIPADSFSADEVLLQVGVNGPGRLNSTCMNGNRPGAALVFAGGEERNQAEQGVSGAN